MMKKKFLALTILLSLQANALPLQMPQDDSEWYYTLGGQSTMSPPPNAITNSIVLSGSANWGMGSSCGAFNPVIGVANTLNKIKSGADAMYNQVVDSAQSAIASLPMLILQRANPGLYDMMMNGLAKATATVTLATKSCEQMQQDIANGDNPYEDMIKLSKSFDWKVQMGDASYGNATTDAVSAKKWVEQQNGTNGVDWVGNERAAGKDMSPVKIPTDIVKAGYNISFNRQATSDAAAPSGSSKLAELWPTPAAAEAFSKSVLGEDIIRTYQDRPIESRPGRGLAYEISAETKALKPELDKLISGATKITADSLNAVSAPNIAFTRKTILSLKEIDPMDRTIIYSHLLQEIAISRVVEKALTLRRLIIAGSKEPNISENTPGLKQSRIFVKQLDATIDDVMYEVDINKKLATSTANVLQHLGQRALYRGNYPITPDVSIPKHSVDGGIVP